MITAVDTSVLVDVLAADPDFAEASGRALARSVQQGSVVVSEIVWAETAAGFPDVTRFRDAMDRLGIDFVPMDRRTAEAASTAWRRYRVEGGLRTRIVADFLVGAHASLQAERLLTRDRGFFRQYFRDLVVIDPTDR